MKDDRHPFPTRLPFFTIHIENIEHLVEYSRCLFRGNPDPGLSYCRASGLVSFL